MTAAGSPSRLLPGHSLRNRAPWKTLRVFRRVVPVVFLSVLVVTAGLAGCSSGSHPTQANVTTPADALAAFAEKGAAASYSATYSFHQASPDTTASVQVWRADASLRVDVVAGATTATLLVTPTGSYSCSITGPKRSCLLVAGAGDPLPKPFDVAPANLFTADLRALAADSAAYDVKSAPSTPAAGPVPAAECFDVSPQVSSSAGPESAGPESADRVPAGRYCFIADGLLAAASYPSGNTVHLTAFQAATPAPGQFTPYAKPTPLPS